MPTRPYPWKCHQCRNRAVYPNTFDYRETLRHDGRDYEVQVPTLETPRCRDCGAIVMTDFANKAVSEALRRAARLLTPEEIRAGREQILGLRQKDFAKLLDVAEETVSRWETGAQIQQRAFDDKIRLAFCVPEASEYLAHRYGVSLARSSSPRGTLTNLVTNTTPTQPEPEPAPPQEPTPPSPEPAP